MLNISYQDFSEVHSYLLSMNAFFDSAISHMNSALSNVPSDISGVIISKYSEIIEVLSNCYSSIIPSISGAFDDFIYRMSKVDDYFAMYDSSNVMGDLTNLYNEFTDNHGYDDGKSLAAFASSVDEYFNRLVSMGITDGNMTLIQDGISRFKESGDFDEIEWVYNYMFEKYNDIYLNGLYNFYWDSDEHDSILFGDQSIKELYAETNAYLSESQSFEGDDAYNYWKWKYGIDIDQRRLDNEYARYKELEKKAFEGEDLTDEEIEEYETLQNEYDERYDEIYNLQSKLYDSLDKNFLEDFLKMVFWDVPLSVAGSFVSGALHVVENIVDGVVILGSGTANLIVPLDPEMQAYIKEFVGTNWTEEGYFELMEICGVDSDIASQCYQLGAPIGTMGGYLFLGTITSGAGLLIDLGVSALAGAGDAAETAFQNGATFEQGYKSAVIAGGLSIVAELGLSTFSKLPASSALYKRVLSDVSGAAFAASEPFLNSWGQYLLYASNQVDENGNLMYTDFWDYMDKTGGWAAVGMAGAVGAGRVHGGQANAAADVNATPEVKSDADVNATPEVKSDADVNATPEVKSDADVNATPEVKSADDVSKANKENAELLTEYSIRAKIEALGYDTSDMSFEQIMNEYGDVVSGRVGPLKTVKTEDVEAKILKDYNSKQVDPSKQYKDFSDLKAAHPDEVKRLSYENYKQSVVSEKTGGTWGHDEAVKKAKTDKAKFNTEMNGKDWDDLSYSERQQILADTTVSEEEISAAMAANVRYAEELADANIKHIEELCANGKVKSEYSPDDLVRMIRDDVSQKTILTDETINEIYSQLPVDANGKTKVVLFQNGEGKNFTQYGGMVGAPDGAYVMPLADANAVINKCTVDGKINTDLLTKELGGVEFGENVIMITVDVDVKDIDLANGALSTAYPGDWTYGCKTFGVDGEGVSEFIISPHYFKEDGVNIDVISGNKTVDQLW